MRVRISRSWDNRAPYQGGGRCAPPFPERKRHQPFVFGQPGTRRAKRCRPRPPPTPASPPPAHAPGERSEQWRPAPPHPPACAASPKTQGSPRPSPERFRRRGRRPRKPPEAASRTAAMRRGQAKGNAGGFPVGVKGSAKPYICVGADTPMSDKQSAITERTASHAARRARTSSGATGRPSLGSTWHAA